MSAYGGASRYADEESDDEPRRFHSVRTRPRDRDDADYVREETYIERGKGPGPRDLVYRGRDDSTEDIPRDFPPPGRRSQYDGGGARRTRSVGARSRYDDDDRYTDYAAAGAAGYAQGRRSGRDRRRRDDRDYDSDYSDSPPRRDKERRKSGVADVLEGLGLGGVVGGLLGKKDKDRSRSGSRGARSTRSRSRGARSRRRSSDEDSDRSRSRPGDRHKTERKWAQAAQAALVAGAVEAFLSRKEAGPWTGKKGKRIATAALGAGGIDGLLDRNPNEKTKRHLAEAVVGGLAANRLANGPANKPRGLSRGRGSSFSPDSRAPRSRSRSIIDRFRGRSQSRGAGSESGKGAVQGLVAGGALAAAGKAIYDRVRSKSRRRRSPSRSSSADSYVPSRNRRRDKRRSPPSDTGRRGQAGTGSGQSRGQSRGLDTNGGRDAAAAGAAGAGAGALATRGGGGGGGGSRGGSQNGQDSQQNGDGGSKDSGDGEKKMLEDSESSTTDMEKKRKSMRWKEFVTAGLASIATIHAAHGVYSSMEAHEKRHKLVAEGEMSPEEARKQQTKAWVQDAAAVGIAALGIKGAFSEWKEMNEQRHEIKEIEKRKSERRKKLQQRKKKEEQERHERMMQIMDRNPALGMGYAMGANGMTLPMGGQLPPASQQLQQPPPPPADQSGNPYAQRQGR